MIWRFMYLLAKKNKRTNAYVIPEFLILRENILFLLKYTRLENKISTFLLIFWWTQEKTTIYWSVSYINLNIILNKFWFRFCLTYSADIVLQIFACSEKNSLELIYRPRVLIIFV